jgi:glycosyltransferase involved in cell wall biosynthesis
MTPTFHLLTGEYPPAIGGVGDYTRMVAAGLVARGAAVHVWCPATHERTEGRIEVHRLPDAFGPRSRAMLRDVFDAAPACVLLQYVPNALGARGANVPFCLWLRRMRSPARDIRVMFHEPYFYFSGDLSWQALKGNALAIVQRLMAALLLRASSVAYISTASWERYLTPAGSEPLVESPIPSTVGTTAPAECVARYRARFGTGHSPEFIVGHFGTFGEHVGRELMKAVPALLHAIPLARVAFIGSGGESFAAALGRHEPALAARITSTGALSAADACAALRACDVMLQPYPDGVTTRRTSVMAALANEVAVVTTDGALTEAAWRSSRAVRLAPAGDSVALASAVAALLADGAARQALAATGRRLYDQRFAIEHTLDALLDVRPAA